MDDGTRKRQTQEDFSDTSSKRQRLEDDDLFQEQLQALHDVLPQVDPEYLHHQYVLLKDDPEELQTFVSNALDYAHRLPRIREEPVEKKDESYDLDSFLERFPDPFAYFAELPRQRTLSDEDARGLIFYNERREAIIEHFNIEAQRTAKIYKAKENGDLLECECCFAEDLLFEEAVQCEEGHVFCRPCVRQAAEVCMSEGNTSMACFADCEKDISLQSLKSALKPAVFLKLEQLRYAEEVQAAAAVIEDFETCPFCNVGASLPVTSNVFECVNPECRKKSCRLCRRVSHIPLRCEEVEEDDEVKARTAIEDKMTEALVRTCVNCKKKIVKETGCNKLTCICGQVMCYLCRQAVQDYSHFNGQGGQHPERCALWSSDEALHVKPVLAEAKRAKAELAKKNPSVKLKNDPTKNLPQPRGQQDVRHDVGQQNAWHDIGQGGGGVNVYINGQNVAWHFPQPNERHNVHVRFGNAARLGQNIRRAVGQQLGGLIVPNPFGQNVPAHFGQPHGGPNVPAHFGQPLGGPNVPGPFAFGQPLGGQNVPHVFADVFDDEEDSEDSEDSEDED